jgi:hypothetical protein
MQSRSLRFPSKYHGTDINHGVSHYSVIISPELLAYHTKVLQALILSADQNALVKRLVVRNPTIRQTWHLLRTCAIYCSFCDRVGGRHFEQNAFVWIRNYIRF